MNRHVSLFSLLLAATFAAQGSAAAAAPLKPAPHAQTSANAAHPSKVGSQAAAQKSAQLPPVKIFARPPQMFPPGPSGHGAPPSE